MMKLSRIAAAAALVAASPFTLAAGGPLDLSSGSAGFSSTPIAGGFSEVFTFSLVTPAFFTGSVTTAVSGLQNIDFMGIFLTGPGGAFSFTKVLNDPFETWVMPATLISAGSYALTLIGSNSPAIASYGGNVAVSPVPEPEKYALLLAGLGMVLFCGRRRGPN